VGSGLCYVAMSWCVKQRGPVFTAAFTPLLQIFVAVLDFTILKEEIYLGRLISFLFLLFYDLHIITLFHCS
jgi:drug/metabolite transporter (DMT)-like permease